MRLYESTLPSGNAYKVILLLAHLGISYETTFLDILATPSETQTEAFLKLNPNGRIPILLLDDGTSLAESNAILFYLSEGTKYLPRDKLERAKVLQWLFFEQYSHEPYVAVLKFLTYWGGFEGRSESEIKRLKEKGQAALGVMERHLQDREWFVGGSESIADLCLFAYTMSAATVGF
ncbi:glutathione S-transferase domain-containing protein [Lojkania enalia]|uniref:Glutathione S-transferase domain-containing protein n=1 Tax=Lojkania enalia TaxID=147567 RepID=A0A9P4N826_9PLEO|nr:glutathione S-transferase domain-containing protein [Didymosphaeria enalia]